METSTCPLPIKLKHNHDYNVYLGVSFSYCIHTPTLRYLINPTYTSSWSAIIRLRLFLCNGWRLFLFWLSKTTT